MRFDVSGLTYGEMMASLAQLREKAFSIVTKGESIFVEVANAPVASLAELDCVCFSC